MGLSQKSIRLLNKVVSAGFDTEKKIEKMTMDDILSMNGITIVEAREINRLIKSVGEKRLLSFLVEEAKEPTKTDSGPEEVHAIKHEEESYNSMESGKGLEAGGF